MQTRYNSKIDAWLMIVIIVAFLISLASLILELLIPGALQQGGWISALIVLVVWAFIISLIWPLYYEITPTELVVRSGILHWKIPLDSIQKVSPSQNMLASPALSLDRLRIEYSQHDKTRFMLISPKDKQGFLQNLAQNAGGFEQSDDGIVRLA